MPATEASGNGPDTSERAPLDARGWVPSVFRARPAKDKGGRAVDDDAHNERWADPERVAENSMPEEARRGRERACVRRVYVLTYSLPRQIEETEPWSAAGLWPGRRGSVDTVGGSRPTENARGRRNWLRRAQVHLGLSQRT